MSRHAGRHRKLQRARQIRKRVITVGVIVIFILVVLVLVWSMFANQPDASQVEKNGIPVLVGTKQYSAAPPMLVDQTKNYLAVVRLERGGEFTIQLLVQKAPITVNSFVFLARQGYYDGVTFHRVLEGFMAQGGDPTGTGGGGPGYTFGNELNDLEFDKAGVVAMANTGQPNSNGSQFFIMFGPYGLKEADYTIFGQVINGIDVVNNITRRDPNQDPPYPGDMIESITIIEE